MSTYAQSTTVNSNSAPTVQDNENPLTLAGSSRNLIDSVSVTTGARLNSDVFTLSGNSQINTLDGGAIAGAFDVTKSSVDSVLDLTAKLIDTQSANSNAFMSQVKNASNDALAYISANTNKEGEERTLLQNVLIGAAALAALFIVAKYSGWGK